MSQIIRYKSAVTGKWVTKQFAEQNPNITMRVSYNRPDKDVEKQEKKHGELKW